LRQAAIQIRFIGIKIRLIIVPARQLIIAANMLNPATPSPAHIINVLFEIAIDNRQIYDSFGLSVKHVSATYHAGIYNIPATKNDPIIIISAGVPMEYNL
jgi:hypothetical protein